MSPKSPPKPPKMISKPPPNLPKTFQKFAKIKVVWGGVVVTGHRVFKLVLFGLIRFYEGFNKVFLYTLLAK